MGVLVCLGVRDVNIRCVCTAQDSSALQSQDARSQMRGVIIRKYFGVLEDPGQAGSRVRPEMTPGDVFLRVLCIKSVIPGGKAQ